MNHLPLLVILGPTAVGKTDVSLLVAEALNAEIVSCDSVAVYRYMDIGSAKPTLEQRAKIPHHMLDVVYPDEPYNVAMYVPEAEKAISEIWGKGKVAMVVGGTSLYLSALLEGFDLPIAPPNDNLRQQLFELAEREGVESLHRRLREIDPIAAQRIHPMTSSGWSGRWKFTNKLGDPSPLFGTVRLKRRNSTATVKRLWSV